MAPSPNYLASVSLDRFFRLHTMHEPPATPGPAAQKKGQTVSKVYVKSIPTVVVWDEDDAVPVVSKDDAQSDVDEEVWDAMGVVGDDNQSEESDDDHASKRRAKRGKDA